MAGEGARERKGKRRLEDREKERRGWRGKERESGLKGGRASEEEGECTKREKGKG